MKKHDDLREWQSNIDECFQTNQWYLLKAFLIEFLNSQDLRTTDKCLIYIESSIDYFLFGNSLKPTCHRYVRGTISLNSEVTNAFIKKRFDFDEIRSLQNTLIDLLSEIKNVETQEKLHLIIEHCNGDSLLTYGDVITRYYNRFDDVDYSLICQSNFDWVRRQFEIYYAQLEEDPQATGFELNLFIICVLAWIYNQLKYCNSDVKLEYQTILIISKEKIKDVAFSVNNQIYYSIEDLLKLYSNQIVSSTNISINRISYGYDKQLKKPILTINLENIEY